jgi:hypothetical protein
MKKLILSIAIGMIALTSNAQWVTRTINNGIDEQYRIAYCEDTRKKGLLKLEEHEGLIAVYVTGTYFCDQNPTVDVAMTVGSEVNRYTFTGYKSKNNETVFFIFDLYSESQEDFLSDFKRASSFIIRVNESYCTSDIYKFIMTGSSNALEFIKKELRKYK